MPIIEPGRVWITAHGKQILWALGAGVIGVLATIFVPRVWNNTPPVDKGVVTEWNETISRLGIEPVFPPEEDIHVGDLFAIIKYDRRPETKDKPPTLLNRAVKLHHLDLNAELVRTYKDLPLFPKTKERPKSTLEPWDIEENPKGVFTSPETRGFLSIAAFPGFSLRSNREASGGLSAWAGGFGASQQENDLVEIRIPFAETYGVPSLLATTALKVFCNDPFTAPVCTDDTLRSHLNNVTPGMYETLDIPGTSQKRYAVDVELVLVNRVYLSRAIEQTRTLGKNQSAALRAVIDTLSEDAKALSPSGGAANPKPEAERLKALESLLDRLKLSAPGGVLSLTSGADSNFELKQTFPRPVVFGYRAVRLKPSVPDLNAQNLVPGQGDQPSQDRQLTK